MNGGDTKVALGILQKITSNNSLLPANKSGRQKIGQVRGKISDDNDDDTYHDHNKGDGNDNDVTDDDYDGSDDDNVNDDAKSDEKNHNNQETRLPEKF